MTTKQSSISPKSNSSQSTNHVEMDRHFIKEKIEKGIICMAYVPTSVQIADILTKGLFRPMFKKLVDKLGLYNLYSSA